MGFLKLAMAEIEAIVKGGIIIPTTPIGELEGKRVVLKVVKQEGASPEKMYAYIRLLREGADAEEYFEI